MINAINIITLIYLTYCAFKNPNRFVLVYILLHTSFLGFIPNNLILFNIELTAFTSNIIALFVALINWKRINDKSSKFIISLLLLFFMYGMLKPIFDGKQNIMLSLIGSKSYTYYFFAIFLITFKNSLVYSKIFNFIFYISIYYSILYLINGAGIKFVPTAFVKNDFLQCHYDSFMALSLFYLHSPLSKIKNKVLYTTILFIGIYIGDYFSLLATSVILLPLHYIILKSWKNKSSLAILLLASGLISFVFYDALSDNIKGSETYAFQKNAFESRDAVNEFRWKLIEKKYDFGYGFIHDRSHFLSFYLNEDSPYLRTFTFIDSGYTDLMGKFGLFGTILFLIIPLFLIKQGFKNSNNAFCIVFIIQMFAVNITWSVFTYQVGIIMLAIVYSYILINQKKTTPQKEKIIRGKHLNCE